MYSKPYVSILKNRLKITKPDSKKQDLPRWLQYASALSGIASLVLALYLVRQKVEINKMETLLSNQQKQNSLMLQMNKNQDSAINFLTQQNFELRKIDSNGIVTSNNISAQLNLQKNEFNRNNISSQNVANQEIHDLFLTNNYLKTIYQYYHDDDTNYPYDRKTTITTFIKLDSALQTQFHNQFLISIGLSNQWYNIYELNRQLYSSMLSADYYHMLAGEGMEEKEDMIYRLNKSLDAISELSTKLDSVLMREPILKDQYKH